MPTGTTETARVPEDISGRQRRMPVGGITWRHTFRALRHRNYRLFFWGQLVSLTGTWMQQTAMSWYVYQITNSKFLLGVVSAVGSAPMMFSSIWGGTLADLYPKPSILVATQAAQMTCAFLLAAGVWLGFATTPFIMIVAALNGVSMGFDMPARQAFTVEMTSREDLLNAISLNSSIVNGARVVGPSVAGLMIGAVGVAMCFFLNGLSFIAVIAGLLMMRLPPFEPKVHVASAGEHAWKGIVYSMKHVRVRTILGLLLAVSFTRNFVPALVLLFVGGFGMLLFFATSNTVLQTIVPDEMRGRVMGVWSLVFGAMIPLGSLEAGTVAHLLGTSFALAFGAIICAVSALVTLFVIRRREARQSR